MSDLYILHRYGMHSKEMHILIITDYILQSINGVDNSALLQFS